MQINPHKAKEEELDLLVDTINKESRHKREKTKEQLKKMNTKHAIFFTKCENLAQQFVTILAEIEADKPLDKAYRLF